MANTNNNQEVRENKHAGEVVKKKETIIRYRTVVNILQAKNDSIVKELKEELNPNTYSKLTVEKSLINEIFGLLTRSVEEVEL